VLALLVLVLLVLVVIDPSVRFPARVRPLEDSDLFAFRLRDV
jgi:hypothetical protein